ncbi:hypothetical protein ACRAWF_13550 [Streptomyces sp. L7]
MISTRIAHRSIAVLLTAVITLPVGTGTAWADDPGAGARARRDRARAGVPPGPYQPWQIDTPDQALAPKVYTPAAEEDRVEPRDAAAGTYALVEYVPIGGRRGEGLLQQGRPGPTSGAWSGG